MHKKLSRTISYVAKKAITIIIELCGSAVAKQNHTIQHLNEKPKQTVHQSRNLESQSKFTADRHTHIHTNGTGYNCSQ